MELKGSKTEKNLMTACSFSLLAVSSNIFAICSYPSFLALDA